MRRRDPTTIKIIGLISNTHGLVRPQALDALRGVDLILHAGDIGKPEVLIALKAMAPLVAIKGNNDRGPWATRLPETKTVAIGAAKLFLIHDVNDLAFDPSERGIVTVISGHSHKPSMMHRDGVLFVNPGSAGPRRFKLPVAVGKLRISAGGVQAKIIELSI